MKTEKLIEELIELKEEGYTEIQGLLFAENLGEEQGKVINVQRDSDWSHQKDTY